MKKKILLAVLLVVILLGAGITYAYFATDMFKTEKEMFFSYIGNSIEETEQDKKIVEYIEKKEEKPYSNNGEITFNMTGLEDESISVINNSKISFEGKSDNVRKIAEQKITLEAQGINIPIIYRNKENIYGIQTNMLDRRFIAIKNENLKQLFKRFGVEDVSEIPDKIELENSKFTKEEIKTLEDRYYKIINENLEDELFTKENVDNQKVIKLTMTEQKLTDILIKLLETLRDDEIIFSKFPQGYDTSELKNEINETIEEIKSNVASSNKFEIKLYTESRKIVKGEVLYYENDNVTGKILIETSDKTVTLKMYSQNEIFGEVIFTKETIENDANYKICIKSYSESRTSIEIGMKYKNIMKLQDVEEEYSIKIATEEVADDKISSYSQNENNAEMTFNYKNQIKFEDNITIDNLDETNSIIINDATDEEIQNLIMNVYKNLGLI